VSSNLSQSTDLDMPERTLARQPAAEPPRGLDPASLFPYCAVHLHREERVHGKKYKQYPDIAPVSSHYSREVRVDNMFFIAGCMAKDSSAEHEGFPSPIAGNTGAHQSDHGGIGAVPRRCGQADHFRGRYRGLCKEPR
jgi:hypothetical protein